jgi:hypothetical protein
VNGQLRVNFDLFADDSERKQLNVWDGDPLRQDDLTYAITDFCSLPEMKERGKAKTQKLKAELEPVLIYLGTPFQVFRSLGSLERHELVTTTMGLVSEDEYSSDSKPDFFEISKRALEKIGMNPPSNSTAGKKGPQPNEMSLEPLGSSAAGKQQAGGEAKSSGEAKPARDGGRVPLQDISNRQRKGPTREARPKQVRETKSDEDDVPEDVPAASDADFEPEPASSAEDSEYEDGPARKKRKIASNSATSKPRNPEWAGSEVRLSVDVYKVARELMYEEDAKKQYVTISQSARLAWKHLVRFCKSQRGDLLAADIRDKVLDAKLLPEVPKDLLALWADERRSEATLGEKFGQLGDEWRFNLGAAQRHERKRNKYDLSAAQWETVAWWADTEETKCQSNELTKENLVQKPKEAKQAKGSAYVAQLEAQATGKKALDASLHARLKETDDQIAQLLEIAKGSGQKQPEPVADKPVITSAFDSLDKFLVEAKATDAKIALEKEKIGLAELPDFTYDQMAAFVVAAGDRKRIEKLAKKFRSP